MRVSTLVMQVSIRCGLCVCGDFAATVIRIRLGNRCARALKRSLAAVAFGTQIAVGSHRIQREISRDPTFFEESAR
jgi:hypothetical protein